MTHPLRNDPSLSFTVTEVLYFTLLSIFKIIFVAHPLPKTGGRPCRLGNFVIPGNFARESVHQLKITLINIQIYHII
jgi:hypothetical protein